MPIITVITYISLIALLVVVEEGTVLLVVPSVVAWAAGEAGAALSLSLSLSLSSVTVLSEQWTDDTVK